VVTDTPFDTTWDTVSVPERCSCGATLPEDALFCHRCGKPQRELLEVEVETPVVALPPPVPAPPPIGFSNGPAVRIGLAAAVLSILATALLGQLPLLQALAPIWLILAGFLAVFVYRRRTHQKLSTLSGARLGWICGIFGFVIITIMLTLMAALLSEPSVASALRDQWRQYGKSETDLNQLMETFQTPASIGGRLVASFLLFTVLPTFGGAIGAKFLDRD
jgi:hypothetical protein